MTKLGLDRERLENLRDLADSVVSPVFHLIGRHSTLGIERAVLRLLGVEGPSGRAAPEMGFGAYPLVNALVDSLGPKRIKKGAAYWLGSAKLAHPQKDLKELCHQLAQGKIKWEGLPEASLKEVDGVCQEMLSEQIQRLRSLREQKRLRPLWRGLNQSLKALPLHAPSLKEAQAKASFYLKEGAELLWVPPVKGQSLLDYVPEEPKASEEEGFFSNRALFKSFQSQAAQQNPKDQDYQFWGFIFEAQGLCLPEISAMASLEGVQFLQAEAFYGIFFRSIHPLRQLVDQHFARRLAALSGITLLTGFDQSLRPEESFGDAHVHLGVSLLSQALAKRSGLSDSLLVMNCPWGQLDGREESWEIEWAQAQMMREVFPRNPLAFFPSASLPSEGGPSQEEFLMAHLMAILNLPSIEFLNMGGAQETLVQESLKFLRQSEWSNRVLRDFKEEILFQAHGKIARRARQVVDDTFYWLKKLKLRGLAKAFEEGAFAKIKAPMAYSLGEEGLFNRDRLYYNPLQSYLVPRMSHEARSSQRPSESRGRSRRSDNGPKRPRRSSGRGSVGSSEKRGERGGRNVAKGRPRNKKPSRSAAPSPEAAAKTAPKEETASPKPVTKEGKSLPTLPRRPLKKEESEKTSPAPAVEKPSQEGLPTPGPSKDELNPLPRRPLKEEEKLKDSSPAKQGLPQVGGDADLLKEFKEKL